MIAHMRCDDVRSDIVHIQKHRGDNHNQRLSDRTNSLMEECVRDIIMNSDNDPFVIHWFRVPSSCDISTTSVYKSATENPDTCSVFDHVYTYDIFHSMITRDMRHGWTCQNIIFNLSEKDMNNRYIYTLLQHVRNGSLGPNRYDREIRNVPRIPVILVFACWWPDKGIVDSGWRMYDVLDWNSCSRKECD
jgi:hypothetical protein